MVTISILAEYIERFDPCTLSFLTDYSCVEDVLDSILINYIYWLFEELPDFEPYQNQFNRDLDVFTKQYKDEQDFLWFEYVKVADSKNSTRSQVVEASNNYSANRLNAFKAYQNKAREIFKPIALQAIKDRFGE